MKNYNPTRSLIIQALALNELIKSGEAKPVWVPQIKRFIYKIKVDEQTAPIEEQPTELPKSTYPQGFD